MKKSLLSGLFWVLLANLLVKPFWLLGIEVGVQNEVGTEMYGLYFGIFNITYIFNILLDLGITNFNTRNIAQYPHLIRKHLSGILSIKLLLLLLYCLVTFSVGLIRGYGSTEFKLLAILSFNQFLNSLILYLRSNFEGLLLFKWDSLLSILDRLLMIIICGTMLWGPERWMRSSFSIFHFALVQTAAYIVTAALAVAVLIRKTGLKRLHFNWPFSLAILRRSLPFALLVLLMASYNRLDPVLLQSLSPDGDGNYNAGIYAGAFRLLDALTMIAYLVSVPLLPVFSKMTGPTCDKTGHSELAETIRMMFGLMLYFSVTASCALSSAGDEIMGLFFNENSMDYVPVFKILIFCIVPISMTYIFGTLLTAAGRLRQLNIFAASSLLLNIIVNIVCIPLWGAAGSAIAGLSAQSLMALAQMAAARKFFHLKISASYIIKTVIFTLSVAACTFCIPHLSWWTTLLAVGVIATVLSLFLKLIDIKELIKTIKK